MKKIILFLLLILAQNVSAKIWLPSILSDNMVLQQKSEANIWGWTTAMDETITINVSWSDQEFTTKAPLGVWSIVIPTPEAGGPFTISISGHEKLTLKNVMIGEVWLASGQSNMEWTPLMGLTNADKEIEMAQFPNIRFFKVTKKISKTPQDELYGSWEECSPESIKTFSSVAYFFGRRLHQDLNVPIGLINSSWGGTNVETWIPEDTLSERKHLVASMEKIPPAPWWPKDPGLAYNSMIHPIIKYNITGAIWYQGESNRANPKSYKESFALMIETWRERWNKEMPFYFVQIAPFDYGSKTGFEGALVHEAQLQTMLSVDQTGMVVTNDIGELKNIHPINKQDVGKRLALWALAKTYGVKNLAFSGPVYDQMQIVKNKIRISFQHADQGLQIKGKELTDFYISGSDQKFYKATAKIKGNQIEVSSNKVKSPVAVRFAFSDTATPNLYNAEGLPASGFRTDDWEVKF